MKALIIIISLLSSILFDTKKANAGVGSAVMGVMMAKAIFDTNEDFKKYCYFDLSYLAYAVFGYGPAEEIAACQGNVTAIGVGAYTAYIVAYTVAKNAALAASGNNVFVASAAGEVAGYAAMLAYISTYLGGIWNESRSKADNWRICGNDDGVDTMAPLPYSNKDISNILEKEAGSGSIVNQKTINEKQNKVCVKAVDGTHKGKIKWLDANECFADQGVKLCAYRFKGYKNILCVHTSSTCPCRHPIDKGDETMPEMKVVDGNVARNEDGDPDITIEPNFLRHCRMLKSDDMSGLSSQKNDGLLDDACYNYIGSSRNLNGLNLTAPITECVVNSFRNLLEKYVVVIPSNISISSENDVKISQISYEMSLLDDMMKDLSTIISLSGDLSAIDELIKNQNSVIYTLRNRTISILSQTPMSDFQISQTNYYIENFKKLTDSNIYKTNIAPVSAKVLSDSKELFNVSNMSKMDLSSTKYDIINGNINITSVTLFGQLQAKFKIIIIVAFALYIVPLAYKMINGEINMQEIKKQFITIGIVGYFALGDGWKDYGVNLLMNASSGIAETTLSIVDNTQKDNVINDQCNFHKQMYTISGAFCKNSNGEAIDDGKPLSNERTCRRYMFYPRPNYELPFMPVQLYNPKVFLNHTHVPVRCTTKSGDALRYSGDNKVSTSGIGEIYYAKRKLIFGQDRLICELKTDENELSYLAEGYNVEDLKTLGYIDPFDSVNTNQSGTIVTAFFTIRSDGNIVMTSSDESSNAFYNRLSKMKSINELDSYRVHNNLTYGTYPVYRTDTGSVRDMRYLAMFDMLDCKLAKSLMVDTKNKGIPRIILLSLTVIFSSFSGFIASIALLMYALSMLFLVLKVTQNFIVGMVQMLLCVYISVFTIPCSLFTFTEHVYKSWLDKLKSYIIYPPASFLLIAMLTSITDVAMYKSDNGAVYPNLFSSDGTISKSCMDGVTGMNTVDSIKNAPLICLITWLGEQRSSNMPIIFLSLAFLPMLGWGAMIVAGAATLGTLIPISATGTEAVVTGTLFMKSITALAIMIIGLKIVDLFEKELQSIFGAGDMDIGSGLEKGVGSAISATGIGKGMAKSLYGAAQSGQQITRPLTSKLNTMGSSAWNRIRGKNKDNNAANPAQSSNVSGGTTSNTQSSGGSSSTGSSGSGSSNSGSSDSDSDSSGNSSSGSSDSDSDSSGSSSSGS